MGLQGRVPRYVPCRPCTVVLVPLELYAYSSMAEPAGGGVCPGARADRFAVWPGAELSVCRKLEQAPALFLADILQK